MSARSVIVNSGQVINEVIDGEAVIINLGTGDYFSLRGSGAAIWSAIEQRAPADDIAAALALAGMHDAGRHVTALIEQLLAEGLLVPVDDVPAETVVVELPVPLDLAPPSLEKFTDMQDLILLDPVHEVDERGWPHAASGS